MAGQQTAEAVSRVSRIAGLDEWRGVLVLVVAAAHFVTFRAPGDHPSRNWEPAIPLAREPGAASLTAGFVAAPSGSKSVEVRGFAIDPLAEEGDGVADVRVAFGWASPRPVHRGLATPGLAAVKPGFAHAGWLAILPPAGIARGEEVPVRVLVRRVDGAEAAFTGSVRYLGNPSPLQDIAWPTVLATAAVQHFFVISGFLITAILVRSKGSPGFLRTFWSRRAARILPLAWLLVVVAWFTFPEKRHLVPTYLLLYNNYLHEWIPILGPMWSLMVEEQFYLVFPLLVWLTPRRWLWLGVGATCLALAAARLYVPNPHVDGLVMGVPRTHLQAIALALGSWLALVREGLVPRPGLCAAAFGAWIAMCAAFGSPAPLFGSVARLGLLDPVVLGGAVVLLLWLTSGTHHGAAWLRFLGVRCYGIYLLHVPLLFLINGVAPGLSRAGLFGLWSVAVLGLATLSFRWFETPLLTLAPSSRQRSLETREPPATVVAVAETPVAGSV